MCVAVCCFFFYSSAGFTWKWHWSNWIHDQNHTKLKKLKQNDRVLIHCIISYFNSHLRIKYEQRCKGYHEACAKLAWNFHPSVASSCSFALHVEESWMEASAVLSACARGELHMWVKHVLVLGSHVLPDSTVTNPSLLPIFPLSLVSSGRDYTVLDNFPEADMHSFIKNPKAVAHTPPIQPKCTDYAPVSCICNKHGRIAVRWFFRFI